MGKTAVLTPKVAKKLLVVEDEGEMGLVLDLILADRDIEMDYVSTIMGAEEYLSQQEPSIIVLDNKLPDGFGVDFISYIKAKHPTVKVIMISGFSSVRDVAMENGADWFFEKPFHLKDFYEAIDSVA
jgi:two-component system OmpR family response regulator